jgi:hypothetical protein
VLHDAGNVDVAEVAYRVDIDFGSVLEELVDQDRATLVDLYVGNRAVIEELFPVGIEHLTVVDDLHLGAAEHETGPHQHRVSDNAGLGRRVFQDNGRDGIDTTGGLNDTVIRNCTFRRLGVSGLDLKSHYAGADLSRPENIGILIEKCLFHDMPNAIVLTTNDCGRRKGPGNELLNAANMKKYAPHDIDINDCVIGYAETPLLPTGKGGYGVDYPTKEGEHMRVILLKDAYAIRYRNARLFGDRIMPVYVRSDGGSRHLSKEAAQAIDHSVTGNVLDEPAPLIEPGATEVPFACGPQAVE